MNKNYQKIPVEISARHIHLSQKDLESLFGKGYQLKILRKLQSTNQFAAEETLDIQVGLKKISRVRIVGPVRKQTQVELSLTDAIYLGLVDVLDRITPMIDYERAMNYWREIDSWAKL